MIESVGRQSIAVMKTKLDPWTIRGLVASALVLSALAAPAHAHQHENPRVFPIESNPYGAGYDEWSVAYWQWALGIPADQSPILDATGEHCAEGQSGPVWFLAGTFASQAERSCTIPQGKAILVPVSVWAFGSAVFDCEPSVPGVACDVDALTALAAANADAAEVLEVSVDGHVLHDVDEHRIASPGPFELTLPEGNILGLDAGTYAPQVSDGHWLMLAPLPRGEHVIEVYAFSPGTSYGDIEYTVTTTLIVE